MNTLLLFVAPVVGIVALAVALGLAKWIGGVDAGNDRMKEISGYIHEGAMAFLKREYRTIMQEIIKEITNSYGICRI